MRRKPNSPGHWQLETKSNTYRVVAFKVVGGVLKSRVGDTVGDIEGKRYFRKWLGKIGENDGDNQHDNAARVEGEVR